MDGTVFLNFARQTAPEAVRILLTGHADLDSAIAAVNLGQIFRFLTKPCSPIALLMAVQAAVEQHRLITSERVLLEQTLRGSIKTLTDVLALTSPLAFGRATRIRRYASVLAAAVGLRDCWQLDVAALLSQLASITLPAETVEKLHDGQPLSDEEGEMVDRLPAVTNRLLSSIPRLEVVRGILATYTQRHRLDAIRGDTEDELILRGAQLLRVAVDYDALESHGSSPAQARDIMRARSDCYAPAVLDILEAIRGAWHNVDQAQERRLGDLEVGMVIAEDVKRAGGALFVARGYEVTPGFVERARNLECETFNAMVRVIVPHSSA